MRLRLLLALLAALVVPAVAQARPAPVTWCGADEVAANRTPDLELSAAQQIRFVYVVPQDGADHFLDVASGIATDAAWIDQWWQAQDPTRTPRFDRYPFPNCPTPFGGLDIGFRRLSLPAASFSSLADPSLSLDTVLAGAFPAQQKTVVYYDGPTQNPTLCGETDYLSDTDGGDDGIAYVYLQSGCLLGSPGGGGTAEVAAHELTHNLGAVPSGAPHECPDVPSHACDSTTDLMYPYIADGSTLDSVVLDVGRDDYYAHSGTQWDVQDSGWLEHLPQFPFSLAVSGPGTLSARAGGLRLPCDTGCGALSLDHGTTVSVTASPKAGFMFQGWSGSCVGTARSCTVSIGAETSVTASFVKAALRLTVAVSGKGAVSAPGLECTGTCTKTLAATSVRLNAKPAAGWRFARWTGACAGAAACTVSAAGTVGAVFARR